MRSTQRVWWVCQRNKPQSVADLFFSDVVSWIFIHTDKNLGWGLENHCQVLSLRDCSCCRFNPPAALWWLPSQKPMGENSALSVWADAFRLPRKKHLESFWNIYLSRIRAAEFTVCWSRRCCAGLAWRRMFEFTLSFLWPWCFKCTSLHLPGTSGEIIPSGEGILSNIWEQNVAGLIHGILLTCNHSLLSERIRAITNKRIFLSCCSMRYVIFCV